MGLLIRIFVTLLVAIATLVANAACVCARPATTTATHACCGQRDRQHVPAGECGHCHASAIAVADRDAAAVVDPPIIAAFDVMSPLTMVVDAAPRRAQPASAAPPPPDVLARRNVMQV